MARTSTTGLPRNSKDSWESVGLPDDLLERRADETLGIPVLGEVRSHNLANAVAIVVYEALRQTGCLKLDQRP